MDQAPDYGTQPQPLHGSSMESIEDAIQQALASSPKEGNVRRLSVALEVEEGGVVGRTQYHVMLNPQPLPPGPESAVELNPQPLPPSPEDAVGGNA